MTLSTGTISLSQVNTELGYSASATISLNDAAVRALAGVSSGTISMSNLQGKSAGNPFTVPMTYNYTAYYNNGRETEEERTSGGWSGDGSVVINGSSVRQLTFYYAWGDGGGTVVGIVMLQIYGSLGQSHFTSLSGNGYTKLTSETAFYYNYGYWTEWRWTTSSPYTNLISIPRYQDGTAVNKSLSWA